MFISSNPKFVYVSFTKSGSSSVYAALRANFTGKERPRHNRGIPKEYNSYPSFCVVRNPYSRLVSWWWSICKVGGDRYGHKKELQQRGLTTSFKDFLTLWAEKNGIAQAPAVETVNQIDYVIRLENLEEEFNNLPFISSYIQIPKKNSRNYPHWTEIVDETTGRMISETYKRDFELFGYKIEY